MNGFVDEVTIEVVSGDGGDGIVSFRREKYVPRGGPNGGDGGKGGNVLFQVKDNVKTLSHLRRKPFFKAENGRPGQGNRMTGRDGADVVIPLPPGTVIRDAETGETIKDFSRSSLWVYLEGGRGGKGNWHFRSSTRQAPRIAQPGRPGIRRRIVCELKLIADIGLVGLPNAGKSTLLSVLTKARPKIADYPFTTLIPNLGVLNHKGSQVIIADIPGIIEDASQGAGLGVSFLKHIARTRLLVFLVEAGGDRALSDYGVLAKEIMAFSANLAKRKRVVVVSKADQGGAAESLAAFARRYQEIPAASISSTTGEGIEELKDLFIRLAGSDE
ncbi:MAG: GTPase ObgE [Spirochaetales bacterium]|nr:GTPase ObgE [Spirochaetales bacterium]